ncbi:HIRAN domain-containing protein [Macrococcoides caseolyticum]|nr:HIRAN domain-containing protein [Macrococcus caseolyticus]
MAKVNKKHIQLFESKYSSDKTLYSNEIFYYLNKKSLGNAGIFLIDTGIILTFPKRNEIIEIPYFQIENIELTSKFLSKKIILSIENDKNILDFTIESERDQANEIINKYVDKAKELSPNDISRNEIHIEENQQEESKYFKTFVAGLTHAHHQKKLRKVIGSMSEELITYDDFRGDDVESICIVDGLLYKYEGERLGNVYLEFEPENEYDNKAIRVIFHNDFITNTKVGYIPKKHIQEVTEIMKNPYQAIAYISKGDYKYWCEEEDKIKTEQGNYLLDLFIKNY